MNITLTTSVEKIMEFSTNSSVTIPKGTTGDVIDIIIENGEARFLLDFPSLGTYEWYEVSEIEEKF